MKNLNKLAFVLLSLAAMAMSCSKDETSQSNEQANENSTSGNTDSGNTDSGNTTSGNTTSGNTTSGNTSTNNENGTNTTNTAPEGQTVYTNNTISVSIPNKVKDPGGEEVVLDLKDYKFVAYNPDNLKDEDLKNKTLEFIGRYETDNSFNGGAYRIHEKTVNFIKIYDNKYFETIYISKYDDAKYIAVIRGTLTNWQMKGENWYSFDYKFDDLQKGTNIIDVIGDIKKEPDTNTTGGEHLWRISGFEYFIFENKNEFQIINGLRGRYFDENDSK